MFWPVSCLLHFFRSFSHEKTALLRAIRLLIFPVLTLPTLYSTVYQFTDVAHFFYSKNGGTTFLQNVGNYVLDYTISHPRRL
jgi:hypothetical protein